MNFVFLNAFHSKHSQCFRLTATESLKTTSRLVSSMKKVTWHYICVSVLRCGQSRESTDRARLFIESILMTGIESEKIYTKVV